MNSRASSAGTDRSTSTGRPEARGGVESEAGTLVVRRTLIITNKLGLHARAAAQLVQLAATFGSELEITKDGQSVNGKSIMGLMMLAAGQGSEIAAEADGEDAEAMLAAITELVDAKFHEGE